MARRRHTHTITYYGAAQTYLVAVNPRAHVPAILKAEHIQGEEQRPTVESGSGRVTCVPRACDDGLDGDTNRWSGGRKNQLKARIDREPYGSANWSRKSMENRKEERIGGVNRRRRRRKRKSMEQEQLDRGSAPPPCIPGAAPATLFPFPSFPTTLALSPLSIDVLAWGHGPAGGVGSRFPCARNSPRLPAR